MKSKTKFAKPSASDHKIVCALVERSRQGLPLVARACICPNQNQPAGGYVVTSPSCEVHGTRTRSNQ